MPVLDHSENSHSRVFELWGLRARDNDDDATGVDDIVDKYVRVD